jgi:hypothetical protein
MPFCSPFDELVARSGPPCVFLPDREGAWKLDPEWSRDAWTRDPGPHAPGDRYVLLRDHQTGYVAIALTTSPSLLRLHPRMDVRTFIDEGEARAARARFGEPPVCKAPW